MLRNGKPLAKIYHICNTEGTGGVAILVATPVVLYKFRRIHWLPVLENLLKK